MKIVDENIQFDMPEKKRKASNSAGNVFLGVILILVGIVWLFNNLSIITPRTFSLLFSWPMLMVVIGGYLLAVKKWIAGALITIVGAIFFITSAFNVHLSFSKVVLPVIIILIGVAVIVSTKEIKGKNKK